MRASLQKQSFFTFFYFNISDGNFASFDLVLTIFWSFIYFSRGRARYSSRVQLFNDRISRKKSWRRRQKRWFGSFDRRDICSPMAGEEKRGKKRERKTDCIKLSGIMRRSWLIAGVRRETSLLSKRKLARVTQAIGNQSRKLCLI